MTRWVLCPECRQPREAELTHNGVCPVLHLVCCGWGHSFSPDDGWATPEEATNAEGGPYLRACS